MRADPLQGGADRVADNRGVDVDGARQQDAQSTTLVDDLPSGHRQAFEGSMEHVRMDRDATEGEDFLLATLDAGQEPEREVAWHPGRRALFGLVAGHWRRGVRRREALRLARAGGFGLAKRVFRALGRQLARAGLLDAPGDLLWLTVDELDGAVRGHAITRDLRALAALRKDEWSRYRARTPPQRVTVHGIAAARVAGRCRTWARKSSRVRAIRKRS